MPVKYISEKTGEFLDNDAVKKSGAPRAYGIHTADDLIATSLASDKKQFNLYRPKLWDEKITSNMNEEYYKYKSVSKLKAFYVHL